MIRVSVQDPAFYEAYWKATRALGGVERLETPRQYGARWREAYRCRIDPEAEVPTYIFDRDEDYTWFMLRWA